MYMVVLLFCLPLASMGQSTLLSPTPGSTLDGPDSTFIWTSSAGAVNYALFLGSTGPGSYDVFYSGTRTGTSLTIDSLPVNGETIYARLYTRGNGTLNHVDYTFTSASLTSAALTAPKAASAFTSSTAIFTWTAASGATGYQLFLGSTGPGSYNVYDSGKQTVTSLAVNGLPINGAPVYARLYTWFSGTTTFKDYAFTASSLTPATLTAPLAGATFSALNATFAWTAIAGATNYELFLGTTSPGSYNVFYSGDKTVTTLTVPGLPSNGEKIYARLYTRFNTTLAYEDYTFTAATILKAVMISPAPGSTLGASNVTFTWSAGTDVAKYDLLVGINGPGSADLYNAGATATNEAIVPALPAHGSTIYVRLMSDIRGTWQYTDYTYTEKSSTLDMLSALACGSTSITGSESVPCTITLNTPAPTGGQNVSLSSSNAAVVIPSTVIVTANTKSAGFTAKVSWVGSAQVAKIAANTGSVTESLNLQLNAAKPKLSIDSTSLAFGSIAVNTTVTKSVTLTSTGTAPVTISSASVSGTGFTVSGSSFPLTLIPGQAATLELQFHPPAAGSVSGQLTVVTNASTNGTQSILLSGDGQANLLPASSVFAPPAANACQSNYDQFYGVEPGVYAYWALCEAGSPIQIYDYVGQFDLTTANQSFGSGVVSGGAAGPVPDGETAASVPTPGVHIEAQGIPLNTHQGTVSTWINADAESFPVTAVFFGAVSGKSQVSISVNAGAGFCFNGNYVNEAGTAFTAKKCGYTANTWHRVTFSWSAGSLNLYVDGASVATSNYTGALDNNVFYYKLFPGCCNTGKQMTLAKVSISNQAWSASQAMTDFTPSFPTIPSGGVYISTQALGTIHKDILGYGDLNQFISSSALKSALLSGLTASGFTTLRYDGGRFLGADQENWQSNVGCTFVPGVTAMPTAQDLATANNIDTYLPSIAQPLGLDIVYTVNYGTNPPACDAGGDPTANGADLVQYANLTKGYGIKYWEIGNELFSSTTESDFHPNPFTGASYATYEPEFYTEMKAKDPTIKIAVPVDLSSYQGQSGFDLPVLAGAEYDAVAWHNYPMKDPITDGATLYQDRVASNMSRTRGSLLKLQTELMNNGKSADAIWITEWNGEVIGDKWSKQTMGAAAPLFAASQLAEYMQAGVQLATWWAQGMTDVCSTFNYDGDGDSAYSWWECGDTAPVYTGPETGVAEVAVGLLPGGLTPSARAFQILSQSGFVIEGEHMVRTHSDVQNAPWLLSYAATHGSSYAVILINRDRDSAHTIPVTLEGMTSGSSAKQWSYGRAQYDESREGNWTAGPVQSTSGPWSGEFNATLPPWSVNVIVFVP
jgi:hypothetical protein